MDSEFLNPQQILSQLKLKKNMIAVDFGSGSGGWTLPLAKMLIEGKVYAIDILEEPLSALLGRAKLEKIFNIEIQRADVEKGVNLPDQFSDLVLMTNLLFQVEDKKFVLEEGKRILKKKGKILIVDWKENTSLGPEEGRVSSEEIEKIAKEISLKKEKEFEAGPYHWGLILTKE